MKNRIALGLRRLALVALSCMFLTSAVAELWIGERPLFVAYQGHWYFPVFKPSLPGSSFGQEQNWTTDWKLFSQTTKIDSNGIVLLEPLIPWGPYESDLSLAPPAAPDFARKHWLGTDTAGRDVLARLVYGFRIGSICAVFICAASFLLATLFAFLTSLGPNWLDLVLQRALEIWDHLPFFYVFIALQSIMHAGAGLVIGLMILFSWTHLSLTLRSQLLSIRSSDAILMTDVFGFSWPRKAFVHLLPYLYPIFASLFPFALASTLGSLTALESLGFALPDRWPSWGELLQEGLANPSAPWLTAPVLIGLIVTLTFTSLIGEASRKATQPRRASEYR